MDEGEEQDETERNLDDAQWVEPFVKADLNVVFYADADKVVVQYKRSVNPTELVSDGEYGDEYHP